MQLLSISVLLTFISAHLLQTDAHTITFKKEELLKYFHNTESRTNFNNFKNTSQRIAEHGYPVETHDIMTNDGYIITIFRIPAPSGYKNSTTHRPIVLLQHGLFGSSDSWLLLGPDNGLPFMLANAGFDVWLGNSRGNFYGRRHANISLFSNKFWRFSWHEIGHYDLPAIIDYALATNRQMDNDGSLYYIGFSQGTTACMVMLSTRPAYNDKIKMAHFLAPVAYVGHIDDQLVRTLAPLLGHPSLDPAKFFTGQEFLPQNELFIKLTYNICNATASQMTNLCGAIAFMLEGYQKSMNKTALKQLSETHPAGCSSNQIIHFMQEQQSKRFCEFDYGVKYNEIHYAQSQPPDYQLKNIKAPLHLWYGDNDKMATLQDVQRLSLAVPGSTMHHIEDPEWAHGHFMLHNQLKNHINEPIISIIKQNEETYCYK